MEEESCLPGGIEEAPQQPRLSPAPTVPTGLPVVGGKQISLFLSHQSPLFCSLYLSTLLTGELGPGSSHSKTALGTFTCLLPWLHVLGRLCQF